MFKRILCVLVTIIALSPASLASESKESFAIITSGDLNDDQGNKVNYYTAPNYRNSYSSKNRKRKKNSTITRTVAWEWKVNNHNLDRGKFKFTATNNHIDTTRVCNNYSTGSLTYKSCRNAAKAWFKEQCSAGSRIACPASAMRP